MPGRLPDAVNEFETVMRMQPGNPWARYRLAAALAQIPGREPEAVPLLEALLQTKPDFAPARQLLEKLRAGQ
jgi:predicted Zn-dependent protease